MAQYLLGIDNGGTVSKAALYDETGREVTLAKAQTRTLYPHPGHIERDLDELWAANARVIAQVIREAKVDPASIAGVATAGYGSGLHLVKEDGSPAWNGIISTDSRASDYVQRYYRDGTFARVLPRTCQSIWAAQPAALLPWFRDHHPEVLERTRWILSCKDYIRFKLTGEPLCEVTDSSGTSLVNIHDPRPRPRAAGGLRDLRPPEQVPAHPPLGRALRAGHARRGRADGPPRGHAGGGRPLRRDRLRHRQRPRRSREALRHRRHLEHQRVREQGARSSRPASSCPPGTACPGYWLILEASPTSASNLEWFVSELLQGGKEPPGGGAQVFEECSRLVDQRARRRTATSSSSPSSTGATPGPNASSCFLGMHGWHTRAHLLRAVFEGVAFSHRTHVDQLMAYRDRAAAIRFAGGATKSPIWLQMFADVLQLPVEVTATQELGAMGAAICAGRGGRDVRLVPGGRVSEW